MKILASSILLLLSVMTALSAGAKELNLYTFKHAQTPQEIDYRKFPRINYPLYRGMAKEQFDYVDATKAMLGDSNFAVESAMLTTVKQGLLKKPQPLLNLLTDLQKEYEAYKVEKHINNKLKSLKKELTPEEAFKEAVEILSSIYSDDFVRKNYLDYNNPKRIDFPKAFMYSSLHLEVSKIYGPNILIFNESSENRSLDLNYWNFVVNQKWVHTHLTFPDRGEFITPFYIPANHIRGFQWNRSTFSSIQWNVWSPLRNDLGLVLMKHYHDNRVYVLAFDAKDLAHVQYEPSSKTFCSAKSNFDPAQEFPSFPQIDCRLKPKLISVIRNCSDEELHANQCTVPAELFEPYETSTSYPMEMKNLQFKITQTGHTYVFENRDKTYSEQKHLIPEEIKLPELAKISVTKNIFTNSSTIPQAKIFDKCKSSLDSLNCDLKGLVLQPGEALYLNVPEDIQHSIVIKASLTHFQDAATQKGLDEKGWDSVPGYSSIQYFSSNMADSQDPWRYFGGPSRKSIPKGALFAEIFESNRAKSRSQDVSLFPHKGSQTDIESLEPLMFNALRIVNLGTDPVHYLKLRLDLKQGTP